MAGVAEPVGFVPDVTARLQSQLAQVEKLRLTWMPPSGTSETSPGSRSFHVSTTLRRSSAFCPAPWRLIDSDDLYSLKPRLPKVATMTGAHDPEAYDALSQLGCLLREKRCACTSR